MDQARLACEQVTVVFLVDVDACLASDAQWPDVWRKQEAWRRERTALEVAEQKRKDQVQPLNKSTMN